MSTEDVSPSITAGARTPTNALSPQELRSAQATQSIPRVLIGEVIERGPEPEPPSRVTPYGRVKMVPMPFNEVPYGWLNAAGAALALYGTFIGIPAGWGIWAAFKIWRMTRHGW